MFLFDLKFTHDFIVRRGRSSNKKNFLLSSSLSRKLSLANLSLVYCVWVVDFSTTKNVGHLSTD